jgi:uncharacterized membrane protein
MTLPPPLSQFDLVDAAALALLALAWFVTARLIEHPPARWPSVTRLMVGYRHEWMRQFVTRQPRIFDANVIDSLRQGTAFFASACMIALGGGVAVLGNSDQLRGVAQDIAPSAATEALELRIILPLLFLANALLKFIWAHRLFGYCSILMAAVPNEPDDPLALHRAAQAAEINITAGRAFNAGLRGVYFALGSVAWLAGPIPLIIATLATVGVLMRREFASHSRQVMLAREP